ncbi:hypothetical protein [Streptomyces acidiscabies]
MRARRDAAERLGLPLSVTLARRDAFIPEDRDEQSSLRSDAMPDKT